MGAVKEGEKTKKEVLFQIRNRSRQKRCVGGVGG